MTTIIQENTVLRSEIDVLRSKCKHLTEENRKLKEASVTIVSKPFIAVAIYYTTNCSMNQLYLEYLKIEWSVGSK